MVDISGLTGYSASNTKASSDKSQLSADMNTFLTLLTTQLKYQDPMDPMDTAEFTNQLVQYSSVEQSIQTNEKLDSLLSLNVANLGAQAVSYLNKTAQVLGDVMPLENGKAKATYTLDKNVTSVVVNVKDMDGKVVYSTQGKIVAGTHEFTWDGKDSNGVQLEDAAYQIQVAAKVPDGQTAAKVTTTVFGRVSGVASDENNVYVGLGDAVTASLGDILTIKDDSYFKKEEAVTPPQEGGDGEDSGSSTEDGETAEG